MRQTINPAFIRPGDYFWEDYAGTNRLCKKLDFTKTELVPELQTFKAPTPGYSPPEFIEERSFAYKFIGPKGKGIGIMTEDVSPDLPYFTTPQYATVENGKEVPWKGWIDTEETMDFHAFIITVGDLKLSDHNLSYTLLLDALIDIVYEYSEQKYTINHLHGLSDYEKLTFINDVISKSNDYITDLIIA